MEIGDFGDYGASGGITEQRTGFIGTRANEFECNYEDFGDD